MGKYLYYDYYTQKDGIYIGVGDLIKEETGTLFTQEKKGKYSINRSAQLNRIARGKMPNLLDGRKFVGDITKLLEIAGNGEGIEVGITNLSHALGPLGRNDFKKDENGNYVCKSFTFEKEWFAEQIVKIQKLYAAYIHYAGEIKMVLPKQYENAISKRTELLKNISKQKNIVGNELNVEVYKKLTANEKRLLDDITDRLKEIEFPQLKNAHKDDKSLNNFFEALSDCMDNVRTVVKKGYKSNKDMQTQYEPLNIFGAYTLSVMEIYKKNMHFMDCLKCNKGFYSSERSVGICPTCQTARRGRKRTIKKDIITGMTLEQVIESHKKIKSSEIKELYSEIRKELNL